MNISEMYENLKKDANALADESSTQEKDDSKDELQKLIELTEKNGKSIFIPPGFAHGFLAREKENIVHYYNTNFRSSKHEIGIIWNDPSLKIKWPIKKPILSAKDSKAQKITQFIKNFNEKKRYNNFYRWLR